MTFKPAISGVCPTCNQERALGFDGMCEDCVKSANTLVCPFDGTELKFQNWDYYCPECGHEFEGEGYEPPTGMVTRSEYQRLHGSAQ